MTIEEKKSKVLTLIFEHPEWPAQKYAEAVGWRREQLYQYEKINAALQARKAPRGNVRRGKKHDGRIEAVDAEHDD